MPFHTRKLIVGLAVTVPVAIVALIVVTICPVQDAAKEAPPQITPVGSTSPRPLDPERTVSDGSLFHDGLPIGNDELVQYLWEPGLARDAFEERLLVAYQAGRLLVDPQVTTGGSGYAIQLVQIPFPGEADRNRLPECGYYGGACYIIDRQGIGGPRVLRESGMMGDAPVGFLDDNTLLLRGAFGDGPSSTETMTALSLLTGEERHVSKSLFIEGGVGVYSEEAVTWGAGAGLGARTVAIPGSQERFQTEVYEMVADKKRLLLTVPRKDASLQKGVREFLPIGVDFQAALRNPQRVQIQVDDRFYTFSISSSTIRLVP